MQGVAHNLKRIVTAFAALALLALPLRADEATLLEELRHAEAPAEAQRIERAILMEWSRTGSAAMDLLLKRGRDALEAGDAAAALEHFSALTDHAPDFAEGFHGRAAAYFELEKTGAALLDLEQALALNPHHFEAIYGLAVIMEQLEQPQLALRAYRMIAAIHPHYKDISQAQKRLEARVDGTDI